MVGTSGRGAPCRADLIRRAEEVRQAGDGRQTASPAPVAERPGVHRPVLLVGAGRHHAAPGRATVGPRLARVLGARVRGVQAGRPRLPDVPLAPPEGQAEGLPEVEAGALVAPAILRSSTVVGPGAGPGARGLGGVKAPDAAAVLAVARENIEVELRRRGAPEGVPVRPVVL